MGSTQQTRQVERLLTGGPSAQVARCLRPATPYHSAARLCGLSAHSHPLLLQHEQPTSLQLKRQGTRQHNKHRAGMTPPTPAYHPPNSTPLRTTHDATTRRPRTQPTHEPATEHRKLHLTMTNKRRAPAHSSTTSCPPWSRHTHGSEPPLAGRTKTRQRPQLRQQLAPLESRQMPRDPQKQKYTAHNAD